MTLEQRVQHLLGQQAWLILTLQQEIDTLKAKLAEAAKSDPPKG